MLIEASVVPKKVPIYNKERFNEKKKVILRAWPMHQLADIIILYWPITYILVSLMHALPLLYNCWPPHMGVPAPPIS